MTGQQLEDKWKSIQPPIKAKFSFQRIDTFCIPELRVGISINGNRCLILKLKSFFRLDEEEKENLKTYYDKDEKSIVLELIDPFYNQLFSDLIISLYQLLKDIEKEEYSTQLFISTVGYWSDFLKAKRSNFLSEEVVQGIYGELVFLEFQIDNSIDPINYVLGSWKGPYDANNDFYFTEKNIEVKTKRKNGNTISITSENQLEPEAGKDLELAVISVILVKDSGDNLKLILDRIRQKTLSKGGNITIISDALAAKNLTFANVIEYDHIQFKAITIQIFDCDHPSFPKLVRSELHNAIQNTSYKLALTSIDNNLVINTIEFI
jgi:hypothetical protein